MSDPGSNDQLTALFDQLKGQLSDALSTPFPATAMPAIEALESHLRASLGYGLEQSDTTSLKVDPANLTQYIDFVRETTILAHQRKTSATFDNASACHDAGVAGVVLISVGTGLNPALGVLGFAIGVYLLLDACS